MICEGWHPSECDDLPPEATYHFGVRTICTVFMKTKYPGEEIHCCAEHAKELYNISHKTMKDLL